MAKDNKVWNVYFRLPGNETIDWEWQCSIPAIVVETVEKDGKTFPGDQWYSDGDELDLAEGRAAMLVLRNQRIGLESRYEWQDRAALVPEESKDNKARKPVPVTFNCKLH